MIPDRDGLQMFWFGNCAACAADGHGCPIQEAIDEYRDSGAPIPAEILSQITEGDNLRDRCPEFEDWVAEKAKCEK